MGLCVKIFILTLPFRVVGLIPGCLLSSCPLTDYTVEGNVSLGLVVPFRAVSFKPVNRFTDRPAPRKCDLFLTDMYKSVLALLFAIEEVNQNPQLLPNITLGFHLFDSCFSEALSLQATFQAISGDVNSVPNYQCAQGQTIPAVIGDFLSSSSITMARVLGLWRVPQVSYAALLPSLDNELEFPSFQRSSFSSDSQAYALVELCKKFGWIWIGVLVSSTEYGIHGAAVFKREASKSGICIAFYETITLNSNSGGLAKIIKNVRRSTASVIILFSTPPEVVAVFFEVLHQNVTGKVWIGTEAWFTSQVILQSNYWKILNGTVGIVKGKEVLPNFARFLQNLNPFKYPTMFSMRQFWETLFNCKWDMENITSSSSSQSTKSQTCTGFERLVTDDLTEYNDPVSQYAYMAHNALYILAHALHNLVSCRPEEGPFRGKSCANIYGFQPWQLLHYVKRVHFVNTAGEEILTDANKYIHGYFDILNWQLEENTVVRTVKVGTFDYYGNTGQKLVLNDSIIQWANGQAKVPLSVCSDSCPPGYRKAPQKGQPVCCFNCVLCPDGMISNQTNSIDCLVCPEDQMPNSQRNKCIPKIIEYLSYHEALGIVLASFSVGFSLITVMVLCVYVKFQDTAFVKANNRNLSYLLLLSLTWCFLCSLIFIGCPTTVTCIIRQTVFGVTFSLCISCVLAKTIMVLLAFKATKPDSTLRKWIGSKTTVMVVVISTCAQVILIMVWLFTSPPFLEHNFHMTADKILLECNEGSIVMFYSMLGYLGFLALLSFGVAFLARSLPDNFNEAMYITFSMLTFLSVWVSFIPAYLSSKGKYIVAVEIFAILFSSFGLLCCIFWPKCYIILLRPSMNTREYLRSSN